MRLLLSFILIIVALVSALMLHEELTDSAFNKAEAKEEENRSHDLLQLELGDAPILVIDRQVRIRPRSPVPGQDPASPPTPDPEPEPDPTPRPDPRPAPQRFVFLEPNGTLSEVAQKHLGTSRRWKEILEVNGWTEAQAVKLHPGTKILLPPR